MGPKSRVTQFRLMGGWGVPSDQRIAPPLWPIARDAAWKGLLVPPLVPHVGNTSNCLIVTL